MKMKVYEHNINIINKEMVKHKLPKRPDESYKGNFGKLFCVCGSKQMPGALMFVINAALKSGVGGIKVCATPSLYRKINNFEPTFCLVKENKEGFISNKSTETIINSLNTCSAAVIGPGLGVNEDTKLLVYEIIKKSLIPLIIDADGINAISENINILKEKNSEIILTPHVGEMSRLINKSIESINSNKIEYASEFAVENKINIVLKGPKTIISDKSGNLFLNYSGNSGMAKGGSGDVLSGIIGSLVSQKLSLKDAAICGVFLHSFAGNICREKFSSVSMLPTDIINELPNVFLKFGL